MSHGHITDLVSAYVLDTLPRDEQKRVESHVQSCLVCRQAVVRERQLAAAVRETLVEAGRMAPGQLERLMPRIPTRRAILAPATRFALAMTLCLLLLGGAGLMRQLYTPANGSLHSPLVTEIAATATSMATPTGTRAGEGHVPGRRAIEEAPEPPGTLTPPSGTPVAAAPGDAFLP